jgi:trk system potassium uptake protein TrkA
VGVEAEGAGLMFVVIVGGGKVGTNVTRTLLGLGHEVALVEQNRLRYEALEEEFQHRARYGDGTELHVLEDAGMKRPPDIVVAATGDDEDNLVVSQLARERYGVPKVVARVNDPRNEQHFDLLGVAPTVSATSMIIALVEHEVPQHELVHLLELRKENLEIVEVEVGTGAPADGARVGDLRLPDSARLISVMREGTAEIAVGSTELHAGDQVLAILEPGKEADLRALLLAERR